VPVSDRRGTSSLDATGSRRTRKRDPPQQRARLKRAQSHESRAIDPFGNPKENPKNLNIAHGG
jgi:hypothetical protein